MIDENNVRRKSLHIYTSENSKQETIIITYKTLHESKTRPILLKEKMSFWIDVGNRQGGRYEGDTPIVFIRKDLREDFETLNIANLFLQSCKTAESEVDLKRIHNTLKNTYGDKWQDFNIKRLKSGFIDKDIVMKKPKYNFVAIKHDTFSKLAQEKHIKDIQSKIEKGEIENERLN